MCFLRKGEIWLPADFAGAISVTISNTKSIISYAEDHVVKHVKASMLEVQVCMFGSAAVAQEVEWLSTDWRVCSLIPSLFI